MHIADDINFSPNWNTQYTVSKLYNGSLNGYFDQINETLHVILEIGSRTEIGEGDWAFGIPTDFGIPFALGYARAEKLGERTYHGYVAYDPANRLAIPIFSGKSNDVDSHFPVNQLRPFTWTAGDKLRISFDMHREKTWKI